MDTRQYSEKYFPSAFIIYLLILLFNISSFSPLFAQDSEWVSFTLNRVNLRQSPSIRGELILTLDEGMPVHIFDEFINTVNERWLHLYYSVGDSGWVRTDFIAPLAALDKYPGIQDFLLGIDEAIDTSPVEQETQTGPEFTQEPEPEEIDLLDANSPDDGILSILSWIYFILSLIVIAILWYKRSRTVSGDRLLSGVDKLQKEIKMLQNENIDIKKQLQFAEEKFTVKEMEVGKKGKDIQTQNEMHQQEITDLKNKFNSLEKTHSNCAEKLNQKDEQIEKLEQDSKKLLREIESSNQKLIKSSESIKAQVIQSTMAGRSHEDSLQIKENKIRQLLDDLENANNSKSQLENEYEEKTTDLRSENKSNKKKLSDLEKTFIEKEQEIDSRIAQARIDSKKWFEAQISDRINEEKITIERHFAKDIEDLKNKMQMNKNMLIENNNNLKERLKESEIKNNEEKKARMDIESKFISVAQSDASKNSALKDLQKENNTLLKEYETSRKNLRETVAKTQPVVVRQPEMETTVKSEGDGEKFMPVKQEPITAKFKPGIPGDSAGSNQYDEYVRSFFKKISKL